MTSSSKSTPPHEEKRGNGEQTQACPACGYALPTDAQECSQCGHVLAAMQSKGAFTLQLTLFVLVLTIALYPYLKRAMPSLERALEPDVYGQRLGDAQFRRQQWKKALAHYQQASKRRGLHTHIFKQGYQRRRALMHYKMAICAMRLRKADEAVKYAKVAQASAAKWMLPYELLAQLYSHKLDKANFSLVAGDLKKRFASHKNTWLVLGNGYARLKMHKAALASYQAGLQIHPKDIQLMTNLAWELVRAPKENKEATKRALFFAKRAALLSGARDFISLDTLSRALWRAGRRKEAIHTQQKAIARAQELHKETIKQPRSIKHQSIVVAIVRMKQRLMKYKTPPRLRPLPIPSMRLPPTSQPAQPTSRPTSMPTVRPLPIFRPLPRIFKRPAPIPRDPRHKRSRQLLLPQ